MKNSFIPVNSIEKAKAFANSLDSEHLKRTQLIKPAENYIQTLDVVETLQKQGWNLKGVCESRTKNRITGNHYIKMFNPDFSMKENGKLEAQSNLIVTNSCDGKAALNFDLGVFRQVCSNGLMARRSIVCSNIKHNQDGQRKLIIALDRINEFTESNIQKFETYKLKLLSKDEMRELAQKALALRFNHKEVVDFDQLLKVNREADKGNSLWLVYNRIQENLTQSGMIVNAKGELVTGTNTVKQDIWVNNQLTELAEQFV